MSVTLANGGSIDRSTTDFYPTPPEVTRALLDFLRLNKTETIWEPAAGEGHMANVMAEYGHCVVASDLFSYSFEDFLQIKECRGDWIITNPPFKHAEEFIRHSMSLGPTGVAMLLKSQYWHAASRLKLFKEFKPSYVLPLTWRPDFLFGKKSSAPTMEVLWTVWDSKDKHVTRYIPLGKPHPVVPKPVVAEPVATKPKHIYRNKAMCRICNDIIESKSRHDFVECKGGHIFLDGGNDYQRAGTLKEGVTLDDIVYLLEAA